MNADVLLHFASCSLERALEKSWHENPCDAWIQNWNLEPSYELVGGRVFEASPVSVAYRDATSARVNARAQTLYDVCVSGSPRTEPTPETGIQVHIATVVAPQIQSGKREETSQRLSQSLLVNITSGTSTGEPCQTLPRVLFVRPTGRLVVTAYPLADVFRWEHTGFTDQRPFAKRLICTLTGVFDRMATIGFEYHEPPLPPDVASRVSGDVRCQLIQQEDYRLWIAGWLEVAIHGRNDQPPVSLAFGIPVIPEQWRRGEVGDDGVIRIGGGVLAFNFDIDCESLGLTWPAGEGATLDIRAVIVSHTYALGAHRVETDAVPSVTERRVHRSSIAASPVITPVITYEQGVTQSAWPAWAHSVVLAPAYVIPVKTMREQFADDDVFDITAKQVRIPVRGRLTSDCGYILRSDPAIVSYIEIPDMLEWLGCSDGFVMRTVDIVHVPDYVGGGYGPERLWLTRFSRLNGEAVTHDWIIDKINSQIAIENARMRVLAEECRPGLISDAIAGLAREVAALEHFDALVAYCYAEGADWRRGGPCTSESGHVRCSRSDRYLYELYIDEARQKLSFAQSAPASQISYLPLQFGHLLNQYPVHYRPRRGNATAWLRDVASLVEANCWEFEYLCAEPA